LDESPTHLAGVVRKEDAQALPRAIFVSADSVYGGHTCWLAFGHSFFLVAPALRPSSRDKARG
ncbi:MAG: hypothetical protein AAFU38_20590, partial [Bacteroidota bacterium]